MSTFNITLNNPSPEAIRALVQEMDRVKRDSGVNMVSFDYGKIEERVLSSYDNTYRMSAERMAEVYSRVMRKAYIFDLDGVLADHGHRKHYIDGTDAKVCRCGHLEDKHYNRTACLSQAVSTLSTFCKCNKFAPKLSKNWKGYFKHMAQDTPIADNVLILQALAKNYKIIFITGRPESVTGDLKDYRTVTEEWIKKHIGLADYELWMRPRGNYKPNAELKAQIVSDYITTKNVRGVFEDNPEAVKMYRERFGLTVYQLDNGEWNSEN